VSSLKSQMIDDSSSMGSVIHVLIHQRSSISYTFTQ